LGGYGLRVVASTRPSMTLKFHFHQSKMKKRIHRIQAPIETSPHRSKGYMTKRKIFDELMEGIAAMKSHREGKVTLRSYKVEPELLPKVDAKLIKDTRRKLNCSRSVFARKLRINERTLEKWE